MNVVTMTKIADCLYAAWIGDELIEVEANSEAEAQALIQSEFEVELIIEDFDG